MAAERGLPVDNTPIRHTLGCWASAASGARTRLTVRATASPISRMLSGSLAERREAHQHGAAPARINHGAAVRLMTAPHVHVIQTRSPSTPPSRSRQYSCSRMKASRAAPRPTVIMGSLAAPGPFRETRLLLSGHSHGVPSLRRLSHHSLPTSRFAITRLVFSPRPLVRAPSPY